MRADKHDDHDPFTSGIRLIHRGCGLRYLAMSDTEFHSVTSPLSKLCRLCCLLEGEADPFDVSANPR